MDDRLRTPEPVLVLDLFDDERAVLISLLSGLSAEEWERPTACAGWSVKDVALHILGGDLGNISRRRDGFAGTSPAPGEDLVTFLNRFNEDWVAVTRRLSTRLVVDLLKFSGPPLFDYLRSLDQIAVGGGVGWAGLDRAPVWLDVAREYTERWLHQQHIRDAVGKPGLTERRFMGPVLAAFAFALPVAFLPAVQPPGTTVHMRITGEAGGDWSLVRNRESWVLYEGAAAHARARVEMDQSLAWRLLTKGISEEDAAPIIRFEGDRELGGHVLRAVAIIA
ncbi:MAG TPA: maleylpyruvate isomerase family mycothiol-dependent enzyme [Chloroflexia bacterium]|nr:maleylpyruvate isomerase family mycothiol-dependent enzyme [Chloroflexia bacterium]